VPLDRQIPGSPGGWLARARGDLALARAPLPEGGFYEDLCFHLTSYAFEARYPAVGEPVGEEEYKQALGLAERVVRWADLLIEGTAR
jgi:HEPN domain-containing protein